MLSKLKALVSYKEIFCATKPSYWWKFYKHTYTNKKDCTLDYLNVPDGVHFEPLRLDEGRLCAYVNAHSDIKERIISSADDILQEHFHLFNITTEKILGQWHNDPVTGYEFPRVYYKDVRKITPQGSVIKNNDIKYPWELSCSHFLVTLAEAYLLTKDNRYEDMFFTYMEDWHKENPVGKGVTWSCTLDVAMRVVNFIASASIFAKADADFMPKFAPYVSSIYTHMLFIADNLEFGFVRENHYLSDIVGLKMAAQCFPHDKKAQLCYKLASNSLREEIIYQVCKDGVDHEASTCYHGFCLDLFMIALATDSKLRNNLNREEANRLRHMVRFTEELCQFEYYPVVGDNDGERVIDLNGTGCFRKEVVQYGKQVMGLSTTDNEYSFLIDGDITLCSDDYKEESIREYHEGGYAIVDNAKMRMLIHSGSIGRKGKGGHGHNDQTSFSLDIDGKSVILDPGSMVYERDLELRHEFRGTAIHNCVMIGDKEQNGISINKPFKMNNDTKASFKVLESNNETIKLVASHHGYTQRNNCRVERELEMNGSILRVKDVLSGDYSGNVSALYTFAKGANLRKEDNQIVATMNGKDIACIQSDGWDMEIVDGRYSPTYAVMEDVQAIHLLANKNSADYQLGLVIKAL